MTASVYDGLFDAYYITETSLELADNSQLGDSSAVHSYTVITQPYGRMRVAHSKLSESGKRDDRLQHPMPANWTHTA